MTTFLHGIRKIILIFCMVVLMNPMFVVCGHGRRPVVTQATTTTTTTRRRTRTVAAWMSYTPPTTTTRRRRIHHPQRQPCSLFHGNCSPHNPRQVNRWMSAHTPRVLATGKLGTRSRLFTTTTPTISPSPPPPSSHDTDDNNNAIYQELKSIAQTILYHDSLYYTPGVQPELTDEEYDALVQREVELCTNYPHYLTQWQDESKLGYQATRFSGRVGPLLRGEESSLPLPNNNNNNNKEKKESLLLPTTPLSRLKRPHLSPMLSLDNITTQEQFLQWLHRLRKYIRMIEEPSTPPTEFVMTTEPKLDGLSLSLRYIQQPPTVSPTNMDTDDTDNDTNDGINPTTYQYQLEWASTRGDGRQGQDVTWAIANDMNHTIPSTFRIIRSSSSSSLPLPQVLEIRGEVVVPCTIFHEKLSSTSSPYSFSNARNAASGILLRLDNHQKEDNTNHDMDDDDDNNNNKEEEEDEQYSTSTLRSYLQFYAYDIVTMTTKEPSQDTTMSLLSTNHIETRSMLQDCGFQVPEPLISTTIPLQSSSSFLEKKKKKNHHDDDDDDDDDTHNDSMDKENNKKDSNNTDTHMNDRNKEDDDDDEWDPTLAMAPLMDYYTSLMNYRLSKDTTSSSGSSRKSSSSNSAAATANKSLSSSSSLLLSWGDYDMDGAVHKVSDHTLRQQIGCHTRSPRWAVAHKFPPTTAVTQLQAIDIQVGRTGALTPVALLKAIDIDGVTIQRATLHNFKHAQQILGNKNKVVVSSTTMAQEEEDEQDDSYELSTQIPQNCSVIVRRAGDVIPQVVRRVVVHQDQQDNHNNDNKLETSTTTTSATTKESSSSSSLSSSSVSWISLEAPLTCPECGSPTILEENANTTTGQVVRCGGPPLLCPPRAVAALGHAYSRDAMDITGLSEARIEQLREANLLHAPSDLFRLLISSSMEEDTFHENNNNNDDNDNSHDHRTMQDQIRELPGWGPKSVQNLVHQATRVATDGISLQRYIYSLGIRHVGRNTSRLLASVYGTVDNFLKALENCSKLLQQQQQQQERQQQQQQLELLESKQGEKTAIGEDDNGSSSSSSDNHNDTVKIIYFPELTGTDDTEGVKDIGPVTISSLVSFSQEEELVRSAKELANAILIHDDEDAFIATTGSRSGGDATIDKDVPLPLDGMTIVFTGSFPNKKRNEVQELAKRKGAKSTPGSISKSTTILVAGDKVGPKKLEKATALGIQIMDPAEFLDMVKEAD